MNVSHIELGMYIARLDRPWANTPFPIEGFYVRDRSEIKRLQMHCQYVYIDIIKGISPTDASFLGDKNLVGSPDIYCGELVSIYADSTVYKNVQPLALELPLAHNAYNTLMLEIEVVMAQITKKTTYLFKPFSDAVYAVVDSIVRNPDAFMWLVRVQKMDKKDPFYHLLRSASCAVVFARHLGLSKTNLRIIALSVMLRDVGRLTLPKVLLSSKVGDPGCSGIGEIILEQTMAVLKGIRDVHPKVLKTVSTMFERLNGSGYPDQLQGDDISLLSKVVGIAVFYDEVTYLKDELSSIPSSKSIPLLYEARGKQFQDDIVVEFIKAFGLYPTGALVRLSTSEIAIVTEQNYARRLKPRVMVVADKKGEVLERFSRIDLMVGDTRSIVPSSLSRMRKAEVQAPSRIDIIEDVQPYDYPIKVTKIREEHIASHVPQKKRSFNMRLMHTD
jgi:HD-GYP domain-containing protein (c-di-GMP phosphodiesterase class II)